MKKQELEKIFQDFIGKGKVQSISLMQIDDALWEWKYKEGNKVASIKDGNGDFLEKMHIEFGGRNPDTCRANDKFLELATHSAEDLLRAGHIPTKIRVKGQRTLRNDSQSVELPPGTGSSEPMKAKKHNAKDELTYYIKDQETAMITRAFNSVEDFDRFKTFLLTDSKLSRLHWYVDLLGTESKSTKDQCVWKREKVGDGTRRMALELFALNSKHFTECIRADLFAAADDMFDSACQRITVKKPKEFMKTVCFYAAEDGKIELEGYEAS